MRSIRTAAFRRLRAPLAAETPVSPLRTRQHSTPCSHCAHRIPSPLFAHRAYSASAASAAKEEPFNVQSQSSNAQQTHYTFFPSSLPAGPPPNGPFSVDLNALKREFLQLQARAHPDLHPQEAKSKAQALSARINEAYKTLQNPLLRAQYLLSLRGIEVAEDERAKVEDPELLMEVLEVREAIEEAESEEDLTPLRTENDERINSSVRLLEDAFKSDDMELAKSETVKLRYWVNIKESLDSWERDYLEVVQYLGSDYDEFVPLYLTSIFWPHGISKPQQDMRGRRLYYTRQVLGDGQVPS